MPPIVADVVVVAPATAPHPDDVHDLVEATLRDPHRIAAIVRPRVSTRARTSDLVADVLDALGRPGTTLATRKNLSQDVTRLTPFLLTDDVTDLILLEPAWLGAPALEDVIATTRISGVRLWLVLPTAPPHDVAELIDAQQPHRLTRTQALERLNRADPKPAATPAAALQRALHLHQITSDTARLNLAQQAKNDPKRDFTLADAHGRQTLRPAVQALQAIGAQDEDTLARLRVHDVAPDASHVRYRGKTLAVPHHLRRALQRQRLHAIIVGQHADDPLLTFDGAALTPSAVRSLADRAVRAA